METFNLPGSSMGMVFEDLHFVKEVRAGNDPNKSSELNEPGDESGSNKLTIEKGSKRRKGKNIKAIAAESSPDNQEHVPPKSKKNQRKGKDASLRVPDSKSGPKKESDKLKEDNFNIPEEWIMQKITNMVPDFEEQGMFGDLLVCAF